MIFFKSRKILKWKIKILAVVPGNPPGHLFISIPGMSRVPGFQYSRIHDTPDIFRGSTHNQCFQSLHAGNSDFSDLLYTERFRCCIRNIVYNKDVLETTFV